VIQAPDQNVIACLYPRRYAHFTADITRPGYDVYGLSTTQSSLVRLIEVLEIEAPHPDFMC
jgi:hypothetical protein